MEYFKIQFYYKLFDDQEQIFRNSLYFNDG